MTDTEKMRPENTIHEPPRVILSIDYQIGTYSTSDYYILHTTSPAHSVAYSSLNPPPSSMLQLASVYKLVHQKVHEWSYEKLCSQLQLFSEILATATFS